MSGQAAVLDSLHFFAVLFLFCLVFMSPSGTMSISIRGFSLNLIPANGYLKPWLWGFLYIYILILDYLQHEADLSETYLEKMVVRMA